MQQELFLWLKPTKHMYTCKIPQSFFVFNVADPIIYKKIGEQHDPENSKKLLMVILYSPYLHLPQLVVQQENRRAEPAQSKN